MRLTCIISVMLIASNMIAQIPEKNLVFHFDFDELVDKGPEALPISNSNALPAADRVGNDKSSYAFDGESTYIVANNVDRLCFEDELSISVWMYFYRPPLPNDFFLTLSNTETFVFGESKSLRFLNSGGLAFGYYNLVGGSSLTADPAAFDQAWHHLVGNVDKKKSELRFYLDNQLIGVTGLNTIDLTEYKYLFMGGGYSSRYASLLMDDLRVYNRALEECEIESLFEEFVTEVSCDEPLEEPCQMVGLASKEIEPSFLLYPNPSADIMHFDNDSAVAWVVRDLHGQFIAQGTAQHGQIDISRLISGIYLIEIDDHRQKIVKL